MITRPCVFLFQVNDDYCDCPSDGSDEPSTGACSKSVFFCPSGLHSSSAEREQDRVPLPSNRINDGVCDCCDGSDEWRAGELSPFGGVNGPTKLTEEEQRKIGRFQSPGCPVSCWFNEPPRSVVFHSLCLFEKQNIVWTIAISMIIYVCYIIQVPHPNEIQSDVPKDIHFYLLPINNAGNTPSKIFFVTFDDCKRPKAPDWVWTPMWRTFFSVLRFWKLE